MILLSQEAYCSRGGRMSLLPGSTWLAVTGKVLSSSVTVRKEDAGLGSGDGPSADKFWLDHEQKLQRD